MDRIISIGTRKTKQKFGLQLKRMHSGACKWPSIPLCIELFGSNYIVGSIDLQVSLKINSNLKNQILKFCSNFIKKQIYLSDYSLVITSLEKDRLLSRNDLCREWLFVVSRRSKSRKRKKKSECRHII